MQNGGTGGKSPRGTSPRALAHAAGTSLPADLEAGSTTRGAVAGVTAGDNLDPERILALVVRGVAGLAQCIQAVLRRTRGCGGESRQLKDHPRAAIQFRQVEGHGRPFGGHLDLGTGSHVAAPGYGELLAIAAENDWRLRRCCSGPSGSTTKCATTGSCALAKSGSRASSGSCTWCARRATACAGEIG